MTSRTGMRRLVRDFMVGEVRGGLEEKPALLQLRDERGRNWLHLCASVDVSGRPAKDRKNSVRLAAMLIDSGIDINAPAFTEGSWQATPLWYAVARGANLAMARFLLERGSSPEHCLWAAGFREDLAMMRLLIDAGANLEAVAEGETPLLGVVKVSRFKAAKLLLQAGADPNFRDRHGMTALHYMLRKSSEKKHYAMFADHGARGDIEDSSGNSVCSLLRRKRDPFYGRLAQSLASGS